MNNSNKTLIEAESEAIAPNRCYGLVDKPNLLVSFSGGETSGYMLYWVLKNWKDLYNIIVVFANTGEENEETLIFVENCSKYFQVEIVWLEAVVNPQHRKGTTHKIVDFNTATRNGSIYESVIKKYGIPNKETPHCNRELKLRPIESYMKSLGIKDYYTAIGIRVDEFDRVNAKHQEKKILYPLITDKPMTKSKINFWWSQQKFKLGLKGYQGNCKWCWKKSLIKLAKIATEKPSVFDFPKKMELMYENYIPKSRLDKMELEGRTVELPIRFFRENKSVDDIFMLSEKLKIENVIDDSAVYDNQLDLFDLLEEEESCDILSACGDD